jgi:hypothetical protein
MQAESIIYLRGFQVLQFISGGTGSGMGTSENPLIAATSRCQRKPSAPHFAISMNYN